MTTSEWDKHEPDRQGERHWSERPAAVWLFRTVNLLAVGWLLLVVAYSGVLRHIFNR